MIRSIDLHSTGFGEALIDFDDAFIDDGPLRFSPIAASATDWRTEPCGTGVNLADRRVLRQVRKIYGRVGAKYLDATGLDEEDAIAEVFMALAIRNRGKCPWDPSRGAFSSYVYRVVWQTMSRLAEKRGRKLVVGELEDADAQADDSCLELPEWGTFAASDPIVLCEHVEAGARVFRCRMCGSMAAICSSCNRNRRYCSKECSDAGGKELLRERKARYQRRPRGARMLAARQARFRAKKVTDYTLHCA